MKIGFEGCSYCSYAKTNHQIIFSLFHITALMKTSPDRFKLELTHSDVGSEGTTLEYLQSGLVFNRIERQRWMSGH